ncbi:MAG: hypothetical protein JRE64_18010 [Deltaproteobacteria bacterium]|nr:hypothetical protein [Deltaproteobacteria bacterium]
MDQARIFVAIALSFAVFLLWEIFFVDKQVVETPKQDLQTETISTKARLADRNYL